MASQGPDEWVPAALRRAQIEPGRPRGEGVFAESVLVSWHGPYQLEHAIYDQAGNLLAQGRKHRVQPQSRIEEWLDRLQPLGRVDFWDSDANPLVSITTETPGASRTLVTASAAGGNEVGSVLCRSKDASIMAAGAVIGRFEQSGRWSGRYTLYDATDAVVGHVTVDESIGRGRCNVIELDERAPPTFHDVVLGIDMAVSCLVNR